MKPKSKYPKTYFQLIKVVFLVVFLLAQSFQGSAQSDGELMAFTTYNGQQFVGLVVKDSDSDIVIDLEGVEESLTLNKYDIKRSVNADKNIVLDNGRYHKKIGWTRSLGLGLVNVELLTYKNIKSRFGLGAGAAARIHYHWETYFFTDLFAYSKVYLNNNRRRLYLDTKVGYAIAGREQNVYRWAHNGVPFVRSYSSGTLIQPGIGFDFATTKRIKWGFKINYTIQKTTEITAPSIDDVELVQDLTDISTENISTPNIAISFYW